MKNTFQLAKQWDCQQQDIKRAIAKSFMRFLEFQAEIQSIPFVFEISEEEIKKELLSIGIKIKDKNSCLSLIRK